MAAMTSPSQPRRGSGEGKKKQRQAPSAGNRRGSGGQAARPARPASVRVSSRGHPGAPWSGRWQPPGGIRVVGPIVAGCPTARQRARRPQLEPRPLSGRPRALRAGRHRPCRGGRAQDDPRGPRRYGAPSMAAGTPPRQRCANVQADREPAAEAPGPPPTVRDSLVRTAAITRGQSSSSPRPPRRWSTRRRPRLPAAARPAGRVPGGRGSPRGREP